MKRVLIIIILTITFCVFFKFGRGLYMPAVNKIKGKETVDSIMSKIESDVWNRLETNLKLAGYEMDYPDHIFLVAFKEEKILQVYSTDSSGINLIREYPFTAFSGKLGPKLEEGDRQIPEGIYQVEYLNPNSAYYLSIKVNYPNAFDKSKSEFKDQSKMGGDIFIHGKSATIGCIPIGDRAIEEIFVLTTQAKANKVKVIISPRDFRVNPEYPEITEIEWEDELYDLISNELEGLNSFPQKPNSNSIINRQTPIVESNNTIQTRIPTPEGYKRTIEPPTSFQSYLRNLPVKPANTKVKYYNGDTKYGDVYEAVVDLPIGTEDLHQCADAVMRLRAEYLWENEDYDRIHFNFTNGHKVEYSEWMKGNRMNIKGNKTWWTKQAEPSNTYGDFWEYMELIFMYAGTASLEKELESIEINEAEIGDVFIKGGFPGHAVIIVDKATKESSGESIYLIAQSYMPAQEIHVLKNFGHADIRPWYRFEEGEIFTPEWGFTSDNLKRFQE